MGRLLVPETMGRTLNIVVGVGYVGRRLLASLPAGSRRGLSRSAAGPDIQTLDLDRRDIALLVVPDEFNVVYTVPPAADDDGDRRLRRFLQALPRPPRRFVYLSTSGVYGDRGGDRVDETMAVSPGSPRARRRVDAENQLRALGNDSDMTLIVLRVPGIYGPGRLGIERIRNAEPVLAEADANPGNRIHVDDLVSCCIAALRPAVPAGIYNVGDGDERSSSWFAGEVAAQLGVDPPPAISRADAGTRLSARRLSFLSESRRLDLKKMRTTLGVVPKYADAADGITASLKENDAP